MIVITQNKDKKYLHYKLYLYYLNDLLSGTMFAHTPGAVAGERTMDPWSVIVRLEFHQSRWVRC